MKTKFAKLEREKALAIARYYKGKGYKVQSRHARVSFTPKMAGVRPDIVARKGKKTVIVEVKSLTRIISYSHQVIELC